jgi:uncharacterized protein YacL
MPKKKMPFVLLGVELVFVTAFLAMLFFNVMRVSSRPFSVTFSSEGFDYFVLLVLALIAGLFYLLLRQKFPQISAEHGKVTQLYKSRAKEKVGHAREDTRVLASMVIELGVILFIAIGIYAVWDEKIAILQENVPWLGKAIIIGVLIVVAAYGYLRFTKPFREFGGFYMTTTRKASKREEEKLKKAMKKLDKQAVERPAKKKRRKKRKK